jgi:uracil DNA glycosylase superfamily protein/LAGLIDADG DNA endonuclease family protein
VLEAAAVAGGDPLDGAVRVRTPAHPALLLLRGEFHRPEKGVPRWLAERLTPRMLAFWLMDAGTARRRPGRTVLELTCAGRSDADRQALLLGLRRLGLAAKAGRRGLYLDAAAARRLSALVAPYVPQAMRHKLHPDVAGRIPFDPEALEPGPARAMYDEVAVEPIPECDRRVFCIDVEETHNFVTAGGVAHNCRPPGNRDPHPAEIDACQDYLMRQVELIEPRVICTLGNFATKLLRGEPTGITRLHGRAEVRTIGPRAVRLYPLFHPAAALYTPANIEVLRADFGRIPELLAMDPPPQPQVLEEEPVEETFEEPFPPVDAAPSPEPEPEREPVAVAAAQLGLF